MTDAGIIWDNYLQYHSQLEAMKEAKKIEDKTLRAGANELKKSVKDAVIQRFPNSQKSNSNYNDKIIDAVRVTKPYKAEAAIGVHAYGTKKSGSQTYKLRFYETSKDRYQKKIGNKQLKKKRKVGNLAKFNGWWDAGTTAGVSKVEPAMKKAFENYLQKLWDNG